MLGFISHATRLLRSGRVYGESVVASAHNFQQFRLAGVFIIVALDMASRTFLTNRLRVQATGEELVTRAFRWEIRFAGAV